MSVQFQGIYHIHGTEQAVRKAAKRYQKGTNVSINEFTNGVGKEVVLNKEDAIAFWKDQGVDAELKQKFKFFHPIRSLKAMIAEVQQLQKAMTPFFANYRSFVSRMETYLKKHSETDVTGQPVVHKNV